MGKEKNQGIKTLAQKTEKELAGMLKQEVFRKEI
jgi:hypothetical protein